MEINKIIYYEFFLAYFAELEKEYELLKEKIRRGKSIYIVAQQMGELQIRINEAERIYIKLKPFTE